MDVDYAKDCFIKITSKCGGYANVLKSYNDGLISVGEATLLSEAETALGLESAVRFEATFIPYTMLV